MLWKLMAAVIMMSVMTHAQWLSNPSAGTPTSNSATITWTSCANATGTVNYGTTTAYGTVATNAAMSVAHTIPLSGLLPSTLYHYQVSSVDVNGLGVVGKDGTFTTAATPPPVTIFTLGATTVFPTVDSGNGNLLLAQKTSVTQSGTLMSLSFYVVTPAGKLRLGVYDSSGPSGNPGKLIDSTSEITPVAGWNTATVLSHASVVAGSQIHLAYFPSSNTLSFKVDRSGAGGAKFYSLTYGAMPLTFSTTTNTTASWWSFYATLSTSAPQPPVLKANLSWTASVTATVVGYNMYRGTVSGGPYTKINPALISGTAYVDAPTTGTYYYVATAVDNTGLESIFSNQTTAVIP